MRTKPIKCLSSVSKTNMGSIKFFPLAVIMAITFPVADSTMICLVQSCFRLLSGLIGFVYADCTFAEILSLSFFFFPPLEFLFSFVPAQSPEQTTSYCGVFQSGQGVTKRCRIFWEQEMLLLCPTILWIQRWSSPSTTEFKNKESSHEASSFLSSKRLKSTGDGGSEANHFCLSERKMDLASLQMAKAHKDTCMLRVFFIAVYNQAHKN